MPQVLLIAAYYAFVLWVSQYLHSLYVQHDILYQKEFAKQKWGSLPHRKVPLIGIGPPIFDRDYKGNQRWIAPTRVVNWVGVALLFFTFFSFLLLANFLPPDADQSGLGGFLVTYYPGLVWLIPVLIFWHIIGPSKSKILHQGFATVILVTISHAATTDTPDWAFISSAWGGSIALFIAVGALWFIHWNRIRSEGMELPAAHPVVPGLTNYFWGTFVINILAGVLALGGALALE